MKHVFFFLAVTLLLIACNESNSGNAASEVGKAGTNALADTSNYTSLQWLDSTFQDLGKVKKGQVVEIAWRFRNGGAKPLIIQSLRPGCGCTVAEKPEAPLATGEEGVIKGKFDSNNQSTGEHRKFISVDANTSGTPYHQLTFRVEVVE